MSRLMTLENPVFKSYLFYNGVLVVKVLAVPLLIARQRFSKKVFMNPEDTKLSKGSVVAMDDPDVERCRRAHLNDIENIPLYICASYFYLMTDPEPQLAIRLIQAYTAARVAHTLVYAVVVAPQPTRALVFGVGYGITAYMAIKAIMAFR